MSTIRRGEGSESHLEMSISECLHVLKTAVVVFLFSIRDDNSYSLVSHQTLKPMIVKASGCSSIELALTLPEVVSLVCESIES